MINKKNHVWLFIKKFNHFLPIVIQESRLIVEEVTITIEYFLMIFILSLECAILLIPIQMIN